MVDRLIAFIACNNQHQYYHNSKEMLRSSISSPRSRVRQQCAVPPLQYQVHQSQNPIPALNASAFLDNLTNLRHLISATTGQPAATALANAVLAPTRTTLSTSNQQFLNQPGEGELWAQIVANPALLMGGRPVCPQTTAALDASANSAKRTPGAIHQEMSAQGISFPSGFPKGPWKTSEEAKNCINKCYAQQTNTGCGAFTVVFRSSVMKKVFDGASMSSRKTWAKVRLLFSRILILQ